MSGPLGYVETQRVVLFTEDDPLVLRGGGRLDHVEVAYETYGELSPARDNAVFVCHALTGDAHAAGLHLGAKKRGWWDNLIGPGKPVDTDRFFVVSANLLGGCSGTTGPLSTDPATGAAYGLDFPMLHMSDLVAVHRRLLRSLGVSRLHAAVGGSLGGMQVLQWVIDAPDEIDRAVVVAASSRLTPENIAFSSVAREAIMSDPDFHDGRYAEKGVQPRLGQKVARMMAHITYVSAASLEAKFGHRRTGTGDDWRMGPDFEVEHYLQHQGEVFLDRFDALSYLYLTRLLDYFDPFADPWTADRLRATATRFQVTSFDSDWRFDTGQSERMARELVACGVDVDCLELPSPWGHDSFLLEPPGYHDRLRAFLVD
ncbi:homoserine O-acetyltransferase MetX [Nocardioides deserti]|uniref:Homoserine O-succinyltransferase n=1 Tax=Nocardioides deserti TaxID=1588644 RepID=A0ABR6U4T4_9ACTN|nr:homoserine O-acetyltransferase [Nocardioides deserti]MBC2959445.1 homoserine O-acetyltransferase [Nocardioides deserti]GGO73535.1 homoserine O-acetyltransferase [Nocardioides deserti]